MLHILLSVLTDAEDRLFVHLCVHVTVPNNCKCLSVSAEVYGTCFSKAFRLPLFLSVLGPA